MALESCFTQIDNDADPNHVTHNTEVDKHAKV